jgi:cell division septal protein FtsQ
MTSHSTNQRGRPPAVLRAKASKRSAARRSARAVRRVLFSLVLAAALAVAAVWGGMRLWRAALADNDLFGIDRLEVTTDGALSTDSILHSAGVSLGQNLFALRPADLRAKLESNPAIARARVSRQLPNTLRIDVAERVPVARLASFGGASPLAIDATGHVLGPGFVRGDMPLVVGLRDSALSPGDVSTDPLLPDLMAVLEIASAPDLRHRYTIQSLDIRDRSRIRICLATGEEVLLSLKNYESKLHQLPVMLSVARERGQSLRSFDMTVDRSYPAR